MKVDGLNIVLREARARADIEPSTSFGFLTSTKYIFFILHRVGAGGSWLLCLAPSKDNSRRRC